jgi:hypothetical protein
MMATAYTRSRMPDPRGSTQHAPHESGSCIDAEVGPIAGGKRTSVPGTQPGSANAGAVGPTAAPE